MRYSLDYPTDRRSDFRTSLLIDAAINAASSHDVFSAAEELLDQHTPPDVIIRVLTRPTRRRLYPESTLPGSSTDSS
ncbi:hypothetical protein [Telluria aromaticivorans]|uniref:Uncharacterized protein n=1 Tax=Telluria aromaticivorans TaxID=2725995 RepID=A0A7Y2JYC7_9BURK|nr:hypothetical protein [Telluria aromaticivorans]NNG22653.1 hypothetical protein [Telluria aromaticivorans]